MIKKLVRKVKEVEAVQWTGDNIDEIIEFVGPDCKVVETKNAVFGDVIEIHNKNETGFYPTAPKNAWVINYAEHGFVCLEDEFVKMEWDVQELEESEKSMKDSVTLEGIKKKIKDVKYTVLEDGKTTIANVYLENGFTVRGESSCVNPANFDVDLGESIAYKDAVDKIWELEGYLLAQKRYENKEE